MCMRILRSVVFCVCLVLLLGEHSGAAEPRLHAETDTWDFGEVTEGFVARGDLTIENRGDAPLQILNIRATCSGCSAAAATEDPIPPGGKTSVRIQFNTAGYSGKQDGVLYLHSNDPKTPFIQIKVVGTVKRDPERPIVALSEDSWDAEVVTAGQVLEKLFKIRNDGKRHLEIRGVYTLEPLTVSCDKTKLAAGEEGEIKVRIEPKDFRGIINERVVVNTNDSVSPSKTIQVAGYVAKAAPVGGDTKGAIIIRPRDPVKLPGTRRVFYREYEITNRTDEPIVVRCLSAEGHTRLEANEITLARGASRVVKTVPGAMTPKEDRLSFVIDISAYPVKQDALGK